MHIRTIKVTNLHLSKIIYFKILFRIRKIISMPTEICSIFVDFFNIQMIQAAYFRYSIKGTLIYTINTR